MDIENPAFTGFFNEGQKRIDLVLVVKDMNSDEMEEIRISFLINAIKFGLELEMEQGKLPEHKNLIFIKVHAPDAIIEEFGLYFNERKFFKESHVEFINPFFNFLGMQHERELIKIIRNVYPGPANYSTLERSKIVYQILLHLQFGQYENHFGINKLIRRKIILDAFALHDGPYFIQSKQEPRKYVNARQVLFYNWTGVTNIWKMQPIHMIQEYLGERIAFFFAYYEYLNIMLIIISAVGVWIASAHYFEKPQYDIFTKAVCSLNEKPDDIVCSECRNFTICPFLKHTVYCKELKFINRIDTEKMHFYAFLVAFWGLIYVALWKRRERYLLWIWELNEKPDYEAHTNMYKKAKRTGLYLEYQSIFIRIIRGLILLSTAAIFGVWIATTISHVLTKFEKHKTFRSYDRSLAIKIYAQTTDYNQARILDINTPCWEREYKLPNVTETFIHNNYSAIAIQFALALFSCAFPLTPLIILLINIWDIRHKARKLLLGHRRPLLLNASGPNIWHYLIFVSAHVIPLFNVAVIIFQSRLLRRSLKYPMSNMEVRFGVISIHAFEDYKEYAELYKKLIKPHIGSWEKHKCITPGEWIDIEGNNLKEPSQRWWFLRSFALELMLICEGTLLLMSLWIHFLLPPDSQDIQETKKIENKIKQKFYIREGFAK
ncbi:unnamed protein product [Euphydryas editha]|uniref:Anoctamin n=1 Tax=Euphydryas editha TaxID=104508 RepID=A0AAU9ULA6_EUPED|nr:unnamed protein product [Euphydryas editha]